MRNIVVIKIRIEKRKKIRSSFDLQICLSYLRNFQPKYIFFLRTPPTSTYSSSHSWEIKLRYPIFIPLTNAKILLLWLISYVKKCKGSSLINELFCGFIIKFYVDMRAKVFTFMIELFYTYNAGQLCHNERINKETPLSMVSQHWRSK